MKMEQTECSETLAYEMQMPGNNPEESIQQDILLHRGEIHFRQVFSQKEARHLISLILLQGQYN